MITRVTLGEDLDAGPAATECLTRARGEAMSQENVAMAERLNTGTRPARVTLVLSQRSQLNALTPPAYR
jgi:hypothetical protein